jgi:hypothetical protein
MSIFAPQEVDLLSIKAERAVAWLKSHWFEVVGYHLQDPTAPHTLARMGATVRVPMDVHNARGRMWMEALESVSRACEIRGEALWDLIREWRDPEREWEYATFRFTVNEFTFNPLGAAKVEMMQAKGWELVTVLARDSETTTAIFRRQKVGVA